MPQSGGWSNSTNRRLVVVEGTAYSGLFFYSPTPALGNLVGSWTAQAGTDPYGNSYPDGLNVVGGTIFTPNLVAASITAGTIGDSTIVNSVFSGGAINDSNLTFDSQGGRLLVYTTTTDSVTFTSGSGNWTAPAGVTSVKAECWGAGASGESGESNGSGGGSPGGGGGGGEYAQEPTLAVTPGNNYAYSVGAGGIMTVGTSAPGGNTTFTGDTVTVTAHGSPGNNSFGTGSPGGTGSMNTIHFAGGSGGSTSGSAGGGAGGGSSAGTSSAGANGADVTNGSAGGAGGVAPAGGGSGGVGGTLTECVDLETRALTPDGWKGSTQLRVGDGIRAFDLETGQEVWSTVKHVHAYTGRWTMVSIEHPGISAKVTQEHNWLVERDGRLTYTTTQDLESGDLISTPNGQVDYADCTVTEEAYTGAVWCPTTEHGNWVAGRRGTIYVTGNKP